MNTDLYDETKKELDRVYAGELDGELIEDYVADHAEFFNKRSSADDQIEIDDIAKVVRALCDHYNVEYDDGE